MKAGLETGLFFFMPLTSRLFTDCCKDATRGKILLDKSQDTAIIRHVSAAWNHKTKAKFLSKPLFLLNNSCYNLGVYTK